MPGRVLRGAQGFGMAERGPEADNAALLNTDDRCRRAAFLSLQWKPQLIHPMDAVRLAIETGLEYCGKSDPWDIAHETLMQLAVERGFDSNQTDLLGQAEHLASIAEFVTYLLRTGSPFKRPEPITLPNGTPWIPSSFLDPSGRYLRRVVLVSRWDAYRMTEEEHSWRTMEAAIYGVPMDLLVVVLGQERNGRRHGALTKGWQHPVAKNLRFRKRDGTGFDANWEPIFREKSNFSRQDWLDALVEDGLLPEIVLIHRAESPQIDVSALAEAKLARIHATTDYPEPQLSSCFQRVHPCPFRSICPRGLEPSTELGFVKLHHPAYLTPQIIR